MVGADEAWERDLVRYLGLFLALYGLLLARYGIGGGSPPPMPVRHWSAVLAGLWFVVADDPPLLLVAFVLVVAATLNVLMLVMDPADTFAVRRPPRR